MLSHMSAAIHRRSLVVCFHILAAVSATAGQATNVSGKWEFKITMPDGQQTAFFMLELASKDGSLVGDFVGPVRPFGAAKPGHFSFDGKELKFTVAGAGAQLNFTGNWVGDHFEGAASQTPVPWIAMRAEATPLSPRALIEYEQAMAVIDPKLKIKALERFVSENPGSEFKHGAYTALFATGLDARIGKASVLGYADKAIETDLSTDGRSSTYNRLALTLVEKRLYLGEAEEYARKSVAALTDQTSAISKATSCDTLGLILLRKRNYADAERYFKMARTAMDPYGLIGGHLARLYEETGKLDRALDLYLLAVVQGAGREFNDNLESLYRRTHNGTIDGLDEMIDKKYSTRPREFEPGLYRTGRVVLVETFTGAACPPCVAADTAVSAALERYNASDVVVLNYHTNIPSPDPMTNGDTEHRLKYYEVDSVPSIFVDGSATFSLGGPLGDGAKSFSLLTQIVERRLSVKPAINIALKGKLVNSVVSVKGEVLKLGETNGLKLRLALIEGTLHYSGENGIHFHHCVVRSLIDYADRLSSDKSGANASIEQLIDLNKLSTSLKEYLDSYESKNSSGKTIHFSEKKYRINREDLAVIAFVQNENTKEILQAQYVSLR